MGKHEARASLLSVSSMDRSQSPSVYPPTYSSRGYTSGDSYARERFATLEPQYTTAGGYHQREGYAVGSASTSKQTSWMYWPGSKWQWAYVLTVLVQAGLGLGLEAYIFVSFQESIKDNAPKGPQRTTVPTYLSLFIFGFVYQLFLVYDALRMKNTIQIIGLSIYNLGLLVEAAVQSDQIHDAVQHLASINQETEPDFWIEIQPFIIAVPCVIGLGTLAMSFITWKLYHEFAWSIYKDISADLRLKRRFLSYQIYIALLKFDFFFFLAFTTQFLVVVVDTSDLEFRLTVIAIPITIVLLLLAAYWARHESVWGMVLIFVVYLAALAYFVFKLVRMYFAPDDRKQDYLPARRSLTTFAVITVLLLLVTIVYCIICTFNFKKGLKPHVTGKSMHQRSASLEMNKLYSHGDGQLGAGPGPSRMMID